ncbi:NUDIX hydrolase [Streptomyces sp. NPDC006514]|uniref:NUDIX hydrolase n=1 Tax=Streptomyces sp. NPDC006514 TaxID=3154308 RepID=UPI0033ACA7C7
MAAQALDASHGDAEPHHLATGAGIGRPRLHSQGRPGPRLRRLTQPFEGEGVVPGAGWQFPGGTVDRGEDPETCARRELAEVTGLDRPMLGILTVTWSPSGIRLGTPAVNFAFDAGTVSTPARSRPTPRSDCRSTSSKPTGGRTRPKPDRSCCRRASSACTLLARPERAAPYGCCAVVTTADHPPRGVGAARDIEPAGRTAAVGPARPSRTHPGPAPTSVPDSTSPRRTMTGEAMGRELTSSIPAGPGPFGGSRRCCTASSRASGVAPASSGRPQGGLVRSVPGLSSDSSPARNSSAVAASWAAPTLHRSGPAASASTATVITAFSASKSREVKRLRACPTSSGMAGDAGTP